jgi:hypothetical protein
MEWLEVFKRQNAAAIALSGAIAVVGSSLLVYSGSGTKYDVVEYCFKPKVVNSKTNKYCTDDKKYIAPKGFYQQERYVPANPRFQTNELFLISDKLTRLRDIPATNPFAINYSISGLMMLLLATILIRYRAKRYKREFAAFYEELQTDLNSSIAFGEQERELLNYKLGIETAYIKDNIALQDQVVRYQDKTPGEREFDSEQAKRNNELVEYQREIAIAQFKLELAKIEAETAKYKNQLPKTIETVAVDEIKFEELCPGKVGELEFYDWRDLIDDAVGIIIAGNSGSGKTSAAVWVAGWLTKDEPAEVLALDPHANVNVLWEELGIYTISDFKQIEAQLGLLVGLLDARRELGLDELNMQPQVIVFADEINACLENFEDKENMSIAIKRLGSEARKYKIALIAINQSSNCDDLGVSKPMKSNYLLILLNASARQMAQQWKKEDPRRKHIEETAYSCVVAGSVADAIAIHPTHYSYKQFKKKGNKPVGLLPINQLPLTLSLAKDVPVEKDWYEVFVNMKKTLGRVPNTEEIKAKWEEVMGEECSSKQAELIHEYLKDLN